MKFYQYILDRSAKKFDCPECGKKRFVRYVDIDNGEYLSEMYGRCDREDNCGYHLDPYKEGVAKSSELKSESSKAKPLIFVPSKILQSTLTGYEQNSFVQNLLKQLPKEAVEQAVAKYYLGSDNRLVAGGCSFPFIDSRDQIRAIQVKSFDESNHTTATNWIHAIEARLNPKPSWIEAYKSNDRFASCLFGEHLLKHNTTKIVALCEAPKTAVIGSIYLPQYVWLATYNKTTFTAERCLVLKGRKVLVFPDLNAFDTWKKTAGELEKIMPGTKFIMSDLLEKNATDDERKKGFDLADYLIRFSVSDFNHHQYFQDSVREVLSYLPAMIPAFYSGMGELSQLDREAWKRAIVEHNRRNLSTKVVVNEDGFLIEKTGFESEQDCKNAPE